MLRRRMGVIVVPLLLGRITAARGLTCVRRAVLGIGLLATVLVLRLRSRRVFRTTARRVITTATSAGRSTTSSGVLLIGAAVMTVSRMARLCRLGRRWRRAVVVAGHLGSPTLKLVSRRLDSGLLRCDIYGMFDDRRRQVDQET